MGLHLESHAAAVRMASGDESVTKSAQTHCMAIKGFFGPPLCCEGDRNNASVLNVIRELPKTYQDLRKDFMTLGDGLSRAIPGADQALAKNPDDADAKATRASLEAAFKVLEAARKALGEAEGVMAAAYRAQAIGLRLAYASPTIEEGVTITWNSGRKVAVKLAPREGASGFGATGASVSRTFAVQPRWLVRPSVGLSLLAAPEAQYPEFSTSPVEQQFRIIEKGQVDRRVTWGLTMGLTPGYFDSKSTACGFAPWFEATINPVSDERALGLGFAGSWRFIKLGAGMLWVRRPRLGNDAKVGQLLDAAEDLSVSQGYDFRSPTWYLSLGFVGWQPVPRD